SGLVASPLPRTAAVVPPPRPTSPARRRTVPAVRRMCVLGAALAIAAGRAGAGTVGDDGGGALLVNPAAMARRDGIRGQLGLALVDDEIAWEPEAGPIARNQSPSSVVPMGAAIGSYGPWVFGLGAMTAGVSERSLIGL